jgi:DNA-binding transcriptional MerR regulator
MAAPKRELFKAAEVCEMAQVQPYVLRSWEAEFPRLGQSPSGGGVRVYRRADVQLVLRIKQLVFEEGLTLAGARRRLEEPEETPVSAEAAEAIVMEDVLGPRSRERLRRVRDGLQAILQMLTRDQNEAELMLVAPPAAGRVKKAVAKARRR